MERRSKGLERLSDEEENRDRRISQRRRKRARYVVDDDEIEEEEEHDDEDEGEEEGYQEDEQQPGPSTQNIPNQRTPHRPLAVTCGNKKGMLYVEKLKRGEECILCENRWFSPHVFEDFGGKGSSKKWKASIFCDDKPLQYWFEQGVLTTKGYQRRAHESTKKKRILSSNHSSDSLSEASETKSEEETEEDDVMDEEWFPNSEEPILETEEESQEVENGGELSESGAHESKEEEDEMEKGEIEDDDIPAGAENDNCVFEEGDAKLTTFPLEKCAFKRKLKIVVKRLPEKSDCQVKNTEHSLKDSLDQPLDEDALNEEEREHNSRTIDDMVATHPDPSQMSVPPIVRGAEEDDEKEFTQSTRKIEDEQKEISTETVTSPAPLSLLATASEEQKLGNEDIASPSSHSANPSSSLHPPYIYVVLKGAGTESNAGGGPPAESSSASVEYKYENMDVIISDQEAAELQVIKPELRIPQTTEGSAITSSSDMDDPPPSRPSTNCDHDTMDFDQLRREKIKMQIKVLRLQEDYYSQKMKKLKT